MATRDKLRVGVVGTGAFAEACHIPGLRDHPRAEIVAICGSNIEHVKAVACRHGIANAMTDVGAMCARDDIEAVTICSANVAHAAQALMAVAHGKHVFCEKPLAPTLSEASAMVDAARRSSRICQIGFTFRHLFAVEELDRRLRAGDIGQPIHLCANHEYYDGLDSVTEPGWRHRPPAEGGGVLLDSGAHLIDLARILVGPISVVGASLQSKERGGVQSEDVASVFFRFLNGASGQFFASRLAPPPSPNFVRVIGTEGVLEARISRGTIDALRRLSGDGSAWEEILLPASASDGRPHALHRMMASFVDGCLAGRLAGGAASFDDGLAVQRLLDAAAEASKGNGMKRLDTPA
jgi:predicted dehydrogenase